MPATRILRHTLLLPTGYHYHHHHHHHLIDEVYWLAPMVKSLPVEILEAVIEDVACDPSLDRIRTLVSLCASCKTLLPSSQKHLFRDVTLYPPPKSPDASRYARFNALYQTTILFARIILQKPHLGGLVEKINFRFTGITHPLNESTRDLTDALAHLLAVEELELSFADIPQAVRLDFPVMFSASPWKPAIAALLQISTLRSLSIRYIQRFPAEMLLLARDIRTLDMFESFLTVTPS